MLLMKFAVRDMFDRDITKAAHYVVAFVVTPVIKVDSTVVTL